MADEYIKKQETVEAINKDADNLEQNGAIPYAQGARAMAIVVDQMLPADVAPVVHGKWMKEDRGRVEYCAVCDQCGFDWMWSDRGYFKFCPNCGAKMDNNADGTLRVREE